MTWIAWVIGVPIACWLIAVAVAVVLHTRTRIYRARSGAGQFAKQRRVSAPTRIIALGPVRKPELPPKSWLCERCYWVHPDSTPFCSLCGGSKAVTGAGREVVIRQSLEGSGQ